VNIALQLVLNIEYWPPICTVRFSGEFSEENVRTDIALNLRNHTRPETKTSSTRKPSTPPTIPPMTLFRLLESVEVVIPYVLVRPEVKLEMALGWDLVP
jgi:hypothetical protein